MSADILYHGLPFAVQWRRPQQLLLLRGTREEDSTALKTAASMRGRRRRSSVSPVPDSVGEKVLLLFGLSQTELQTIRHYHLSLVLGCQAGRIARPQTLVIGMFRALFAPVSGALRAFYRKVAGSLFSPAMPESSEEATAV